MSVQQAFNPPTVYFAIERSPSSTSTKRPTPSRSSSSTLNHPTRALVRTRTGELRAEQRPKLVSHPSGSNTSSRSSGSTIYVTTPGAAQQQRNGSPTKTIAKEGDKDVANNGEDEDDKMEGSIVLVRVLPAGSTVITAPVDARADADSTISLSAGQLVKTVGRSSSAGGYHRNEEPKGNGHSYSGTALGALTEAMKLESQLLLLKRELYLYQAFDAASGEIFRKSVHDDFFFNINQIILDTVDIAAPLHAWTESRRHHHHYAQHVFKHLESAHLVVGTWNTFYDWLVDVSNKSIRFQREEGRVSVVTWERRRRECMETVERLLRLLGDVEMGEGVRGVLDMQNALRREWRDDGMVGQREAERMGWVWGVRI